jgi:uncharacterized protein (DUF1501 family)
MYGEDRLKHFLAKHPHPHWMLSQKPHLTRRHFFEIVGAGITGSFLSTRARAATVAQAVPQNKAKNVVFILLTGAPSHIDTFDFKPVAGVTPADFNPAKINGIDWPSGLLPKIGEQLSKVTIVRSMRAWALVHSLSQTWTQIGRSPAAALGDVSPNIGSVVALEKENERQADQVFPTFIALNANNAAGPGYFSSSYAPFKINPAATGLPNTANVDGEARHETRLRLLHTLDDPLRITSLLGKAPEDYDKFYASARGLMFNPVVDNAFKFSDSDSERYGNSTFGDSCLVAKQVLAANQGTRFIQINYGSWDHHDDIYGTGAANENSIRTLGRALDDGFSSLLKDLESGGLLNETLVVMLGEFGRTVGPLSESDGRDHYAQHFCVLAGAGIKTGRVIGATNADGSDTADYGWKYNRYFRVEDLEATIYSALGIDWTKQIETPFGRSYEYVPFAGDGLYAPMDELWA